MKILNPDGTYKLVPDLTPAQMAFRTGPAITLARHLCSILARPDGKHDPLAMAKQLAAMLDPSEFFADDLDLCCDQCSAFPDDWFTTTLPKPPRRPRAKKSDLVNPK